MGKFEKATPRRPGILACHIFAYGSAHHLELLPMSFARSKIIVCVFLEIEVTTRRIICLSALPTYRLRVKNERSLLHLSEIIAHYAHGMARAKALFDYIHRVASTLCRAYGAS